VAPPARAALPPAPVILPPSPPAIYPGPYREQARPSLSELANRQLRGKPRDPLAEGMEGAGRDDCLHPPAKEGAATGLLNAPSVVARALTDKCAR
jgi:hypothetical protein